jgi:hypothetical protein
MEELKNRLQLIRENQIRLQREMREKTVGYILGAFGLVAGLAWNEAIKSLIDQFFPLSGNTIIIKFLYAVIITFAVVILSMYLLKLNDKKDGN